jgi:hypothetical protein
MLSDSGCASRPDDHLGCIPRPLQAPETGISRAAAAARGYQTARLGSQLNEAVKHFVRRLDVAPEVQPWAHPMLFHGRDALRLGRWRRRDEHARSIADSGTLRYLQDAGSIQEACDGA